MPVILLRNFLLRMTHNFPILTTLVAGLLLIESSRAFFFGGESPRLLGGNAAKPGEFPWVISLQKRMDEMKAKHQCGGAIVSNNLVFTAAHCTQNRTISTMEVVAGAHNIKQQESTQQRVKVTQIYTHPRYIPNKKPGPYDISILRVEPPFLFNSRVNSITFASQKEDATGECTYAGWGNTFPVSVAFSRPPDQMLTGKAMIVNINSCKQTYGWLGEQVTTAICAQAGMLRGTCQGDSGGPLLCSRKDGTKYLAGVVSFGFLVCNSGAYPDVYTDLAHPAIFEFVQSIVFGKKPAQTAPAQKDAGILALGQATTSQIFSGAALNRNDGSHDDDKLFFHTVLGRNEENVNLRNKSSEYK